MTNNLPFSMTTANEVFEVLSTFNGNYNQEVKVWDKDGKSERMQWTAQATSSNSVPATYIDTITDLTVKGYLTK